MLRQKIKTILRDLDCDDKELSILFTDDRHISQLNKKYLKRDGPTDVISFPMAGEDEEKMRIPILGDIVISIDTAQEEAKELGEELEYTIYRLVIHGILHLLGYDHEGSPKEAKEMFKMEEELLSKIKEVE